MCKVRCVNYERPKKKVIRELRSLSLLDLHATKLLVLVLEHAH